MHGTRLGRDISPLTYGAWGLGGAFGPVDPQNGVRSILTYLELGGSAIDTARDYGDAEALVGRALRAWAGPEPFVATKVQSAGPRSRWGRPEPVDVVFPPGAVTMSVESSLLALGRERVDLVQLHLYWPTWGRAGYWLDELVALRERDVVGAIGVSLPDYRHDVGIPLVVSETIDSVQTIVNPFDPLALDCLVPLARERSIAVLARGVLDEGGLVDVHAATRAYGKSDIRSAFFTSGRHDEYVRRASALAARARDDAQSLAELALRFAITHSGVTTAIVSMHEEAHVVENMRAVNEGPLPAELFEELSTRHRWVRNFFEQLYWDD